MADDKARMAQACRAATPRARIHASMQPRIRAPKPMRTSVRECTQACVHAPACMYARVQAMRGVLDKTEGEVAEVRCHASAYARGHSRLSPRTSAPTVVQAIQNGAKPHGFPHAPTMHDLETRPLWSG